MTNFPETLYFSEALCHDAPFAGTPDLEGQEKLARDCGYSPEDVDCLLEDVTKIDLLRAGKDRALYGQFVRGGTCQSELWRIYYTAIFAGDGYYDIRQIGQVMVYGVGVCRSVRGHRLRRRRRQE